MLHIQIAEAGRSHSLAGDHMVALERYRHALKMAVDKEASPVFLHYYTCCILDTLEAAGLHEQALELIDRAMSDQSEEAGRMGQVVRADLTERRVTLLFLLNRTDDADSALAEALPLGGPILTALSKARRRQLSITTNWLGALRRKHQSAAGMTAQLRTADAAAGEKYFIREIVNG